MLRKLLTLASSHRLKAWTSFLVKSKVIFFEAEFGVTVTCDFSCDIGLSYINIHAVISVLLNMTGLPLSSVFYVNLEIHDFSVYFGDQNNKPPPLTWPGVLELLR
ncbi:MAG: hypothetical protein Q9228_004344 [Teloschistes exilis]